MTSRRRWQSQEFQIRVSRRGESVHGRGEADGEQVGGQQTVGTGWANASTGVQSRQ